jgi:signal transduction histidine kinase
MKTCIGFLIVLLPVLLFAREDENRRQFFQNLFKLEFDSAKRNAMSEKDSRIQFEMLQLAEILFYAGQKDRSYFKFSDGTQTDQADVELSSLRELKVGYIALFYDRTKGDAYRHFYNAYRLAKESENPALIKAALFALLKYYNIEIGHAGAGYKVYLENFERLSDNQIEEIWLVLYKMVFYSKMIGKLDSHYYELAKLLTKYESTIDLNSPVLTRIVFEKAIKFELEGDTVNAMAYYRKTILYSKDYPFLKEERFFSLIKLSSLETGKGNFAEARTYLIKAKREINLADTLTSNLYLNVFTSHLYKEQKRFDSAFYLLKKANNQEAQLDYRRNKLEVNRLKVELETQEKENANLQLRENRTWLISALVGVGLLFLASYLAYTNQRSKNRMQAKEKEVQSMKLEKVLKDQEIFGIDAMLEGQEKERQRMAGDLHDNLGSLLATTKLHFQNIKARKDLAESEREMLLQKTDDLLEEAYQKVRGIAHAGNAGVNAQEGLLPAIKNFASKVSIINRLEIEVEEHEMNKRLDNSLEITVFRIIQELITNIIKHAGATEVVIHLTQHEDAINLMVEDNGNGFDISKVKPSEGIGLHSIQKKIENLGGQVTIDSIAQKGTTVIIDIPLT